MIMMMMVPAIKSYSLFNILIIISLAMCISPIHTYIHWEMIELENWKLDVVLLFCVSSVYIRTHHTHTHTHTNRQTLFEMFSTIK